MRSETAGLMRVLPNDPEYRRQAEAEAAYWQEMHPYGLESLETQVDDGPTDLYQNERFTGDRNTCWFETIRNHGDFRRGLVLGTSSLTVEGGILRTNPGLHLTFVDISQGALDRRAESLGKAYPGRVATLLADMNFIELEPSSYDLIVSCASIHHVTNLEYLAGVINDALTPGGTFFLLDYVGELRFQFDDAKRRVFEVIYARCLARFGVQRPFRWADASDLSPFCGVRSNEILSVFREHLDEVEVRTAGALIVPLMRVRPPEDQAEFEIQIPPRIRGLRRIVSRLRELAGRTPLRRTRTIDAQYLEELAAGDLMADAGLIAPCNAFAIYRKRTSDARDIRAPAMDYACSTA